MQAVLDGEILEVAEPGVDAAQRFVGRVGSGDAGFGGEAGLLRGLDDQLGQPVAAAAVEPVGLGIFVDQPLELLLVLVQPGAGQRRRQMAERDGGDAPLGLRRLAGIGDDEGIDDGQRTGDDLGKAGFADSATVLPGSHSSVPCAPTWTSAWTPSDLRSHRPKAISAWRGGSVGSW